MKSLKLFSIFLVAIFSGLFLPSELFILRSSLIKQDVAIIFQSVLDLKKKNEWNTWRQLDPNIKIIYPDVSITVGEGVFYKWEGGKFGGDMLLIKQVVDNFDISEEISFNNNPFSNDYQKGILNGRFIN